jgi:poly(3-hydroxybutyrate) depolymerase
MGWTRATVLLLMMLAGARDGWAGRPPAACQAELAVPAACATLGPAGTPYATGANCRVVTVDGFPRQYLVYVPAGLGKQAPAVIMHHGSGGDGLRFLAISGWVEKADEVGLVAVFPTALPVFFLDEQRCTTKWNAYGLAGQIDPGIKPFVMQPGGVPLPYPPAAPWPADDLAFERAMIADVEAELDVAPERVYATGFSNGGNFTARLSVDMADAFAAAAWSGGTLGYPGYPPVPLRSIPRVMQVGACDDRIAAALGMPLDPDACVRGEVDGIPLDPVALLALRPFSASMRYHVGTFGLPDTPVVNGTRQATVLTWLPPPGDPASPFQFVLLADVTHQYPVCNAVRCNNPNGFSAADEFWAMFEPGPAGAARPARR